MQPNLGHGTASDAGSKQLAGEAIPKLEGPARPQPGQEHPLEQEQESRQAQAQVGQTVQGTQLPYVPSFTYEMLTTLPAAAFPCLLDTQALLDFDSKEVWAKFNSSFPTESFPPGPFDQLAGATAEDPFVLNDDMPFFNPVAAPDPSALPPVKVDVSTCAPLLSSSPSIPTRTRTKALHFIAQHGNGTTRKASPSFAHTTSNPLVSAIPSPLQFIPRSHRTVHSLLSVHLCFLAFASPRRSFAWN